jgi:hypothetical protein
MKTAYRIPDTPGNTVTPTQTGFPTKPINKLAVRSFVTNVQDGATLRPGPQPIRGIAFDGGSGIARVEFSSDGGVTWQPAKLGLDYGPYSFRPWQAAFTAERGKTYMLACRATAANAQTQTDVPKGAYGAPIADGDVAAIVGYLVAVNGKP